MKNKKNKNCHIGSWQSSQTIFLSFIYQRAIGKIKNMGISEKKVFFFVSDRLMCERIFNDSVHTTHPRTTHTLFFFFLLDVSHTFRLFWPNVLREY